jgi:hypothetical protein
MKVHDVMYQTTINASERMLLPFLDTEVGDRFYIRECIFSRAHGNTP